MFVEGTFSHTLLRLLLRSLGGVMLFLRCSPNADICIALGISALLRDYILELSHYLWITFEASKQSPSYIYSGQRPLTDDDYSHQGQIHTAAALKELRDYLQTPEGKAQSAKVSYRYDVNWYLLYSSRWREARRDDLSLKLDQFTKGLYSGRPYDDEATNENDENEPLISQKSWSQTLFTLLTYSLVCLSLSCIIAFVVFDVGSMDNTGTSSFLSRTRTFLESIGVLQRTNPDL